MNFRPHWIGALLLVLAYPLRAAVPVDYAKDVKPILSANCYSCHGVKVHKDGLRVDTAALVLSGGDDGPAMVPGNAAKSLLLRAILGTAPDVHRMPIKKPPLPDGQIALIRQWIDQGASAPKNEKPEEPGTPASTLWSLVAPVRPVPPEVQQKSWVRNPIDRFVLARLEKKHIAPSPEADRATLLRRVCLDLTGLPPTPAEVAAFEKDKRPDAYEKVVDRLLASPHYGERWGRHWLDAARYADSNGYSIDSPRSIWKYRDWVINALNSDLPFDQFTIDQLAGDMLPNATVDQKIATGFHRNTMINEEGGIDKEQFRVDSIIDRVNTTGTVFLGLTVGCCQCHDHKFDPLTQKEFYQLFAFFNNADEPLLDLSSPEQIARSQAVQHQIEALKGEIKDHLDSHAAAEAAAPKSAPPPAPEIAAIISLPAASRSEKQKQQLAGALLVNDPVLKKQKAHLARLERQEKAMAGITTMVMAERSVPRDSYVFVKGDFTRHGDRVTPGVPAVLPPLLTTNPPNRLDLARWLVDARNPLTARVTMNRVWQEYFGKGIVETENDFGTQGSPPSHPQLLDWLATEFIRQKWSMKAMHRLIVTSATYRQSSHARPELAENDPGNRLLARQSRFRLDAEIVRDVELTASGLLNDEVGGPSVYPPQPNGVMTLGQIKRDWPTSIGPERYRRGMYTFFWRGTPNPALAVFDAPEATSACTRRSRSNTPLQSLTLLNDQSFFELAQGLANRVLNEAPRHQEIDYAFELCTDRRPNSVEKERLQQLLDQQLAEYRKTPDEAPAILDKPPANVDVNQLAAWTTVSRVLLNLDETISRE